MGSLCVQTEKEAGHECRRIRCACWGGRIWNVREEGDIWAPGQSQLPVQGRVSRVEKSLPTHGSGEEHLGMQRKDLLLFLGGNCCSPVGWRLWKEFLRHQELKTIQQITQNVALWIKPPMCQIAGDGVKPRSIIAGIIVNTAVISRNRERKRCLYIWKRSLCGNNHTWPGDARPVICVSVLAKGLL